MDVDESFNGEPAVEVVKFKCNLCASEFQDKYSFMRHRKTSHTADVQPCNKFANGNCPRSDTQCWYNHTQTKDKSRQHKSREENLPSQQPQVFQEASESPFPPDLLIRKMMESMHKLCTKVEIMERRLEELLD